MSAQTWDELRSYERSVKRIVPVADHEAIRTAYLRGQTTVREIADRYGVTWAAIYAILSGKTSGDERIFSRFARTGRVTPMPCPVMQSELVANARTIATATSATIVRRAELERRDAERDARDRLMYPELWSDK